MEPGRDFGESDISEDLSRLVASKANDVNPRKGDDLGLPPMAQVRSGMLETSFNVKLSMFTKLRMIFIPPGSFEMGSDEIQREGPVHDVTFSGPFWISQTEVPNEAYSCFLENTGYGGMQSPSSDYMRHRGDWGVYASPKNGFPAVCLSWSNAMAFCEWLTGRVRKTGKLPAGYVYRLPTEAEWEYAARGGTISPRFMYAGADNGDMVGWTRENSGGRTHPVRDKMPNEVGAYDMSGNVWEWCLDTWHSNYQGAPTNGGVWKWGNVSRRVLRGGAYGEKREKCTVTYRSGQLPDKCTTTVGFRVVLGPDQGTM